MEAIAEAIVPYFGEEAGRELTRLLRRHVLTAVELLSAARGGHISRFKEEDELLIANANEIANFLSKLNEHVVTVSSRRLARYRSASQPAHLPRQRILPAAA